MATYCCVCCIPDDEPLYRWFDPSEGDCPVAHIECAEENGLEAQGDEPIGD